MRFDFTVAATGRVIWIPEERAFRRSAEGRSARRALLAAHRRPLGRAAFVAELRRVADFDRAARARFLARPTARRAAAPVRPAVRARAPRRARRSASGTARARDGGPQADDSDPPLRFAPLGREAYSLDQAATATGLPASSLSDALRHGRLAGERTGGGPQRARWRIERADLLAYLDRRGAEARS